MFTEPSEVYAILFLFCIQNRSEYLLRKQCVYLVRKIYRHEYQINTKYSG